MAPHADADTFGSSNMGNGTVVSFNNNNGETNGKSQIRFTNRTDSINSHAYGMPPRATTTATSLSKSSSVLAHQQSVVGNGGGRSLRDRIVTNKNSSSGSSASGGAADYGIASRIAGDSSETSRRHKNRNTRVLVTGASGFIGSHCVKRLLERGYRVRGTVRDISKRAEVEPLYLLSRKRRDQLELVEAELLDKHCWEAAVDGCDFVVHVASPVPLEEPSDRFDVIRQAVQGTLNVLEACRDSGSVRHVVMTSSSLTMYDSFNPPPRRRGGGNNGSAPPPVGTNGNNEEAEMGGNHNHHRRNSAQRKFSDFLTLRSRRDHSQLPRTLSSRSHHKSEPLKYRYSSVKEGRTVSMPSGGKLQYQSSNRARSRVDEEDDDEYFSGSGGNGADGSSGGIISNSALKQKVKALAALAQRGKSDGRPHDETEWTDLDDGRWHMAYTESKARAEKAAWDFYYSLPSEKRFAFTVIAPTITLGPVLHGRGGSSLIFMLFLLTSGSPFMPHMGIETCDVRDVAEAHARALEMESSHEKRIVIYTQTMWYSEIADVIRREFGPLGYSVPNVKAPAWLIRAMGRFSPHLRLVVARLNRFPRWNNASMKEDLQLEPRVIDVSIIDMMHSLIQRGDVKMTRRYRDWLDRNPHAVFFPRSESNV